MDRGQQTRRAFLASVTTTAVLTSCTTTKQDVQPTTVDCPPPPAKPNTAKVVPRKISPNELLNIAVVGCGGRGFDNIRELRDTTKDNIVALCDVDTNRAKQALTEFSSAKQYSDWRKLLDDSTSFDAVLVATPDHMHAPVSVSAMRLGKHVYCEKPLARTIHEARVMASTAKEYGLATQMGTQGVGMNETRTNVELLRSGIIGAIQEVHVWTDRAKNWWPQGVERPKETPPAPENINWDLWLGVAPLRPYNPIYAPFKWRGWKDFGSGAIGDMGIHNAAIAFLGYQLGMPDGVKIVATSPLCSETFPAWAELQLNFPAQGNNPAFVLHWYDGGHKPPVSLIDNEPMDANGCIIVGTGGTAYSIDWAGNRMQLYPKEKFKDIKAPAQTLLRAKSHHAEWTEACKGGPAPMANFIDFAAPMTEIMQLGNLALRTGKDLKWDTKTATSPDCTEANAFVKPNYRDGWKIEGLG
ncbi:MAG: Gfo/Idh/MocA family oxidoreductase [Candidatus Hydrogenedentes bacterium]|nr:Gfo/Idh/MocA family oxidoreductase [Candidatus Hydrogenedentota bacterium]